VLIDHVIGGKYRITELIGQGGMGTVFEAVHTGTGSRVAIKLIVSNDIKEEIFVRFQREARAAGTIDSQHIVRIFDMGTDDRSGSPFMVMERLFGEDLSQLMRRVGPLSPQIAVALAAQAALGLAKAHESGVVHRDIKPANLFLHDGGDNRDTVVKILDFGIAKVLMDAMQRSEEGGLTRTGSMLGSPHYMSPEQAQGLRSIDHRSDIWSLGVVLYKMLSGQTPHAHLQTLGQVILAICSQQARPIQELAPWVPPEVAMIVHRALQPDPNQRFQSAYEMFAALESAAQGSPPLRRIEILPLSETQRMRVAPGATVFRPDVPTNGTQHGGMTQTPGAQPPQKSSNVAVLLAVAGVMAAVGLAGIGAAVMAKKSAAAAHPPAATATATLEPIASAPVPARERTVTLLVSPPNASVEVDGQKREAVQGAVEIKGVPGAVVSVHLAAGGAETTQNVAITEGGAIPPRLTVTPHPIATPTTTTTTTAGRTGGKSNAGTAGVKPVPSATGTALNAQRNFE
jgi:eukaryotic-like serine/threonine-protein kinase